MNIFDKRPLALILSVLLAGFVASSTEEVWLRVLAIAAIPLLISLSVLIKNKRKVLIISTVALLISILCSYLYFDFWFYPENRFSGDVEISGEITNLSQSNYGYTMYIRTDHINNAPLSGYNLISYISRDDAAPLKVGNVISFTATLSGFEKDEDFDARNYYSSLGINGKAEISGDIVLVSHRDNIMNNFSLMRENLRRRAIMQSDSHTGNLVAALLLGERDMLSGQLRRDFKYIGITHVLALSGMHLAILTVGISKLLLMFGVGKRWRDIISIIFTAAYMAFTGFPVSVVRAGVMLIIASLLRLLSRTTDALTSLVLAVFIICVLSPYSIFDIALWLSAFATLGLVVLMEYTQSVERKPDRLSAFLHRISLLVVSSVFAVCATLPFSAFSFDGISILSAISTMIFSPLIELIMYIGTFMLLFGDIVPIGDILSVICKFTEWLAGTFASVEGCYASVGFILTNICIIAVSVAFYLFVILNLKHKTRGIAIITASFFIMLTIVFTENYISKTTDDIIFESSSSTSYFTVKSEGKVAYISSVMHSTDEEYRTINSLSYSHISKIDKYFITHYSFGLPYYLDSVMSRYDIETILLPAPRTDEEKALLKLLKNTLMDYRAEILTYEEKEEITVGNVKITPVYSSRFGESPRAAFKITYEKTSYAYLSSGMMEKDTYSIANDLLLDSDVAIFGSTGKKYEESIYMKSPYPGLQKLIISSKNLYITQYVKSYYVNADCKIIMHPEKISLLD